MKIVNSVAVIVSCIALLFTNGSFRYGYADAVYIRNKSENFEKIASDIKFLTNSNLSDDKKTIIHRKMQVIANNLSHQGKADSLFYSANPLSIRNVDNVFYIPIGYDNEYKYIARVGWENESDNDAVSISYSKSFADILNTLQAGSYYFVKEDNSIYLRGNNQEYLVECGFENFDGNTENESLSIMDEYVTDIYNDNVIVNANNNRAIASSHINTHHYPNYGNYCFLCAVQLYVDIMAHLSI